MKRYRVIVQNTFMSVEAIASPIESSKRAASSAVGTGASRISSLRRNKRKRRRKRRKRRRRKMRKKEKRTSREKEKKEGNGDGKCIRQRNKEVE